MRFRTKVFALFLLMAVLTGLLIGGFMSGPTKQLFMDLMHTNVLSIAATPGAMLDADVHTSIPTRADQDTLPIRDFKPLCGGHATLIGGAIFTLSTFIQCGPTLKIPRSPNLSSMQKKRE